MQELQAELSPIAMSLKPRYSTVQYSTAQQSSALQHSIPSRAQYMCCVPQCNEVQFSMAQSPSSPICFPLFLHLSNISCIVFAAQRHDCGGNDTLHGSRGASLHPSLLYLTIPYRKALWHRVLCCVVLCCVVLCCGEVFCGVVRRGVVQCVCQLDCIPLL
jgi:hypothetical protein